ncbi:hypothetical protein BY458DRAFT_519738, partial [Sporodiniella umbellata]
VLYLVYFQICSVIIFCNCCPKVSILLRSITVLFLIILHISMFFMNLYLLLPYNL